MKIKTSKLQNVVNMAAKAKAQRSTIDAMTSLLLMAKDGILTVKGINNEYELVVNTDTEDKDIIDAYVDAAMLMPIIGKLPEEETSIVMDAAKNQLVIRSGKARFGVAIKGDSSSFPSTSVDTNATTITVDGIKFAQALKSVVFAAGESNGTNQLMGSINVNISNGKMIVTALDGHRVAMRELDIVDVNVKAVANIPVDVIKTLIATLSGEVTLKFGDNTLVCQQENMILATRLVAGKYFNVDSFTTMKRDVVVTMDATAFKGAIDRANLIAGAEKIPLILEFVENGLKVSVSTKLSDMDETVEAKIENKPTEWTRIGFNPKFILDMVNNAQLKEIKLGFINPKAPAFIAGDDFTYLTLPVNIR